MPVRLRLQRHGRKKQPIYFIVAADSRSPRDGKFLEKIGTYNPIKVPATIELDNNKALNWLEKGAQASDTVHKILSYKGVLYKKHLLRGVKKGAFSLDEAETRYAEWIAAKENAVATRISTLSSDAEKARQAKIASEQTKREANAKAAAEALAAANAAAVAAEAPAAEEPTTEVEAPAAEEATGEATNETVAE